MVKKTLLTQQMADMEKRGSSKPRWPWYPPVGPSRTPSDRKAKRNRAKSEPAAHPQGCLCGAEHDEANDG